MTIELGGMPMLLDVRGNPILYAGDVVAIQQLSTYGELRRGALRHPWTQPWIVTVVSEDRFCAREPFVGDYNDDEEYEVSEFMFGTVAIKLLARGGDDAPVSKSEG